MKLNPRYWPDFCKFATLQILSWDIDPVYPVLRVAFQMEQVIEKDQLWRLVLYLTYYNLASAEQVWRSFPRAWAPEEMAPTLPALPTGIERRGMRGNITAVNKFVQSVLNVSNRDLVSWVRSCLVASPSQSWDLIREEMNKVWGAGSWATYKWADLMKNVMRYPITASDIGVGGGSSTAGPVPGLALLTDLSPEQCAYNLQLQEEVYQAALNERVPFQGLDQFETSLCDFNSLVKGRYYVGHDIDLMMEGLPIDSIFWKARREAISRRYLGEFNGWNGVRVERKGMYKERGVIE